VSIEQAREIAGAILYEGYLLYPYRHSAIKNRQRWTFGVVYPRACSEANGGLDSWTMHTECLVAGQSDTSFDISVRFLHLLTRSIAEPALARSQAQLADECAPRKAGPRCLMAGQLAYEPWEEGIEREVSVLRLPLRELLAQPWRTRIAFSSGRLVEYPADPQQPVITREHQPLLGAMVITAERVHGQNNIDLCKLGVHIENSTPISSATSERRDAVLLQSFVSTHTILHVYQGRFISLLETPEEFQLAAGTCQNRHTWPVLVGYKGQQDTMLSSPIILYDYPQIAPESPGTLFDGTEIDEILALRILTLSDEEKAELREGDERAREILERIESLSPEQFMKLHGAIRELSLPDDESRHVSRSSPLAPIQGYAGKDYAVPDSLRLAGKTARVGNKVRLHPKARADAFDILLAGKTARIEAIQQDFENRLYLVVTLDDDPGREQWDERVLPGHRFFFYPEEVELLEG
jgi:hypothetical protein